MSFYAKYPAVGGSGGGVPTYANFASLPATASDGAVAVTLDTDTIYVFNGGSATWIPKGTGGSSISVGTIDSDAPSSDGATISGAALIMQSASDTSPGLVNNTTQTFSGAKTFTGAISASNLSGTNTGNVSIGTANGLSLVSQALSLALSSTSTTGALSSTDWNTFNGKQASGNYITALTGDGTASGPGSAALTLATVNASPGSFGSASTTLSATVNAKGLITALSSQSIQIAESQVTNLTTDLAAKVTAVSVASANGFAGSSGGTSTPALTLTTTVTGLLKGNGTAISAASSSDLPTITLTGDVTGAASGGSVATTYSATVPLNKGGTGQTTKAPAFDALQPMSALGDVIYGGASGTGTALAGNITSTKKFLTQTGNGSISAAPGWNVLAQADLPTIALTGDVTGSASAGSIATAYATVVPIAKGGTNNGSLAVTAGGVLYTDGSKVVNVGAGTSGQVLQSNAASPPTWNTNAPTLNITSQSTTYSAVIGDYILATSGSAFAITLPTAVGNAGKAIVIKKVSNDFNVITVSTTSSQTVDGVVGTTVNTQYECLEVTSDGANWQVTDRKIPSVWISDNSTVTFAAGFNTVTSITQFRKREGDSLRIRGVATTGSGTLGASTASMAIGNSLVIDSAKLPAVAQDIGFSGGGLSSGNFTTANNSFRLFYDGTDTANVYFALGSNSSGYIKINVSGNWNASTRFSYDFLVPISGWKG